MSNTLKISYDLDGDRYFIGINVTEYDNKTLERKGAEKNTEKLIETFQNGVESFIVASASDGLAKIREFKVISRSRHNC